MQANTTEEPVDVRVRRRLRELRTERGLTLQQVAERASIDVSTLSRLEAGKRRLALDHLPALAAALGVSADELLGSAPPQDPRVRERPRTPRRHDDVAAHPPRARRRPARLQDRHQPGAAHAARRAARARGPRLALRPQRAACGCCSATQDFTIEPGEAVEFTTWTPHWFGAVDGPVELIMIVGPQGERLHLHA